MIESSAFVRRHAMLFFICASAKPNVLILLASLVDFLI